MEKELISKIVAYLNERTGSSFRPASSATERAISARIREGYRLEDFRAVIDEKALQWSGNETMERYLRPQTLFGPKMEGYLEEAKKHRRNTPPPARGGRFRDVKELLG